jgi:hypothetical protein
MNAGLAERIRRIKVVCVIFADSRGGSAFDLSRKSVSETLYFGRPATMKNGMTNAILALSGVAAFAGTAGAAEILVSGNITTSTTFTKNNTYNLQGQVYLLPGATLTIQPGTVIASGAQSALVICRGAQIIANGTQNAPIIMTSTQDRATWTGGNPQTGTYRQTASSEWGGLLLCGDAYISENQVGTNTPAPNASNYADMEGLTPAITSLNDYGGGNDNDDSGSLSYCSAVLGTERRGRGAAGGRHVSPMHSRRSTYCPLFRLELSSCLFLLVFALTASIVSAQLPAGAAS